MKVSDCRLRGEEEQKAREKRKEAEISAASLFLRPRSALIRSLTCSRSLKQVVQNERHQSRGKRGRERGREPRKSRNK